MRVCVLCLLLLLTGCMQAAQSGGIETQTEPSGAVTATVTALPSDTPQPTLEEPTMDIFLQTATQLVFNATASPKVQENTVTAIAHQRSTEAAAQQSTTTPDSHEILFFPSPTMTDAPKTIWDVTPTELPESCARISDSYQELQLQVYTLPSQIGAPSHHLTSISQERCPPDDWSLPFEYQIKINALENTPNLVLIIAIDDMIRRLPDYPPENPDAQNPVDVMVFRSDNSSLFAGRFNYQEGIEAYNSGLRRSRLLKALGIVTDFK